MAVVRRQRHAVLMCLLRVARPDLRRACQRKRHAAERHARQERLAIVPRQRTGSPSAGTMALLGSFAGLRLGEQAASVAPLRAARSSPGAPARGGLLVQAEGASSAARRIRRHNIIRKKVRAVSSFRLQSAARGGGCSSAQEAQPCRHGCCCRRPASLWRFWQHVGAALRQLWAARRVEA